MADKQRNVPDDPLDKLFTPEIVKRLQSETNPSEGLVGRLHVVAPWNPYEDPKIHESLQEKAYRKRELVRSIWNGYLRSAWECGFFGDPHGKELRTRLTGKDDENFRSAMDECMTCWLFHSLQGFDVAPYPKGRKSGQLEMIVSLPDGDAFVEVKSPEDRQVHVSVETPLSADPSERAEMFQKIDGARLDGCFEEASKQFDSGRRNILVFCPHFDFDVWFDRNRMIEPLYGEWTYKFYVSEDPSVPPREGESYIAPVGRFTKYYSDRGGPRHTRISLAVSIEWFFAKDLSSVEHNVIVVPNHYAACPIDVSGWKDCVRLLIEERNGTLLLSWSDGADLMGGPEQEG